MNIILLLNIILISCSSQENIEDFCDDVVVTYESFGRGFLIENCQSCHASTTLDRNGAPFDVVFDEREQVEEYLDDIYRVILSENASMPPNGGITEDDLLFLSQWLICSEGI